VFLFFLYHVQAQAQKSIFYVSLCRTGVARHFYCDLGWVWLTKLAV